jgi:DUF4097 and DUF4098 domain-containing protein YvlB
MKRLLTTILTIICVQLSAQSFFEKKEIQRIYSVVDQDTRIYVKNINGDVIITASDNSVIEVTVMIHVHAKTKSKVEQGLAELDIKEAKKGNRHYIVMDAPFIQEKWYDGELLGTCIDKGPDYQYEYKMHVKVPKNLSLTASTVNNGDLIITGMKGKIEASNVNGKVEIKGAIDVERASTVNGDVVVYFDQNPSVDGEYHTINGDITLLLQDDLNATVYSKSMQGDLFTSYDFVYTKMDTQVNTEKKNRTTYVIGQKTGIKIGNGGPEMTVETLNGNMYLKKI